jgi:lycopene beta-cyclase
MGEISDIGLLGSGPAALAIGAALGNLGVKVTVVAPEPDRRWEPNYCLWADEVPATLGKLVETAWDEVAVATPARARTIRRRYVKLEGDALRERLWNELRAASAEVVPEKVERVTHEDDGSVIHTDGGATIRARVVVDASGARSPFVRRVHGRPPAFQIAYGLWLDAPGHPFDPGQAVLMDFRPASAAACEPPSFLYVLPVSERRLFIEETSLAHRPAVSIELLQARLLARLHALGLESAPRLGVERCSIPMGLGLPARGQALVPYGAAASMVHPASGYSIAHALRKAEPVAQAIVGGLSSADVDTAIAAGNAALWPRADRKCWELYTFGLESLVDLNAPETFAFFDRFFNLDDADWSGLLSGTIAPSRLGAVMTRVFASLPATVQWQLIRTTVSSGVAPLARTFLQSRNP